MISNFIFVDSSKGAGEGHSFHDPFAGRDQETSNVKPTSGVCQDCPKYDGG